VDQFCDDQLEMMSPSRRHGHIKRSIGRMIELYCRRKRSFFQTEGSATLRREGRRGGEPDESDIFTKGNEAPDLVIEAALSRGGIDKLKCDLPLGIPEVWIWEDGRLAVHLLKDGAYESVNRSRLLPGIDLAVVERLADCDYTSEALDAFEAALGTGDS
jgi:Uma2 family endonuclease